MKISEIHRKYSIVHTMFPIKSLNQLSFYLLCSLVGFLFFQWLINLLHLPSATPIAMIGAFSGGLVVFTQILPASFSVECRTHTEFIQASLDIEQDLVRHGYISCTQPPGHMIFIPKVHKLMRWKENTIQIRTAQLSLVIEGPIYMVRILWQTLCRRQRIMIDHH